ncbi:hypothetical protein ACFLWN_01880 [Chloroflexota bacterium]
MNETGAWEKVLRQESDAKDEPDLLPEYFHYRDEGCEVATSCLKCPLAQCVYDESGGKQLYDVIDITDGRAGLDAEKKRVLGLALVHRPSHAEYRQRLWLGAV